MLKPKDVVALVQDQMWPGFIKERDRLDRIDRWYRFDPEMITLPRTATREHRALAELARTPWLGLIVSTMSQAFVYSFSRPSLPSTAVITRN